MLIYARFTLAIRLIGKKKKKKLHFVSGRKTGAGTNDDPRHFVFLIYFVVGFSYFGCESLEHIN